VPGLERCGLAAKAAWSEVALHDREAA
jgi:hypothetical protein